MLPDHPTMEQMDEFFSRDRFATEQTKCRIVEGWKGHGVAEMQIEDIHHNALGKVMGGAIFTLADFALAIACSIGQDPTVNLTSSIEYMTASKGSKLTATADCTKEGRRIAFYDVVVTDDLDALVAKVSIVAYRHVQQKQP